jgi:membrane protease YdiL (CAAX protease family)
MIPPELPTVVTPESLPARRTEAFWDYQDLFVLFGLLVVTVFALPFLLVVFPHAPQSYLTLVAQAIVYLVALGSIAAILRLRYDRSFWRSLGWVGPRPLSALVSFVLGPVVAIGLGLIGSWMHAEPNPLPFEKMMKTPVLVLLFAALVVLVGPLCEELVFRGFMMPLLIRSVGAAAGIVITAALFGALHGFQYSDWRIVLLISSAGVAFGWRRYVTGSTVDSVLMHVGFNLAPFLAISAR